MKFNLLACAALLALAGCHSGSSSLPSSSVNGIASVGAPLVGVVVVATDASGNAIQSSVTDASGKYSLKLTGSGPYVLTTPVNDADGSPAILTSVIVPGNTGATLQANINPLTSLITARVLGMTPTGVPTGGQISSAAITAATITKAEQDIATLFEPVYTALAIPATETADPIGTTVYKVASSDLLDGFFTSAHFLLNAGQVVIGTDVNRTVVSVPATGALSGQIPAASIASLVSLTTGATTTPITNVIVVIGENQTFDAVFGAYSAPQGQTVNNLLSQGIIKADGTPGANFALALQNQAVNQTAYSINPTRSTAYATLPQPLQVGELQPTFQTLGGTPDPRFPANLPNGPFQLTNYVAYTMPPASIIGITTGDPVHRFFQMWQQTGGDNAKLDMFTWVADTVGQGGDTPGITSTNPSQGGELMAFLNVASGDAPYLTSLAQNYAMSDNYHQSILGGTGANFYAISTADVAFFNTAGAVATPPANQIENPNPMANTANFYTQDGYNGGSYVNCADSTQPGVAPILAVLSARNVLSNCDAGKYYLVNNYGPGYDMNGVVQPIGPNNYNYPPQTNTTIAEALANKGVSWKWYTGGRELADVTADATATGLPASLVQGAQYNAIGDPLVASQKVMTTPTLKAGLAGLTSFYNDVQNSTLPAVSFVVPKNLDSGHPGYSVEVKYEMFIQDLITKVKANPTLWAHTAIIITTDEGGGHFDTGSIQHQDFFGDGPRIPFLVVSPYARTNFIDHTYHDHASVLKFIERNWKLAPLTARSRDNHPLPVTTAANLYKPVNATPAVGDLMTMFKF